MDKSPRSYNSHPCKVEMLISGEYKPLKQQPKLGKPLILLLTVLGSAIWHVSVVLCSVLPSSLLNKGIELARCLSKNQQEK